MPTPLNPSRKGKPNRGGFNKTSCQKQLKATEAIQDGGEWWYAPRAASRFGHVSLASLDKYRDRPARKGRPFQEGYCPYLGRAIRTRELPGRNNRLTTYYAKGDLDSIRDARAARRSGVAPEYPDLIHIDRAAKMLGCNRDTVLIRAKGADVEQVHKPGKDNTGRAVPMSYLPKQFVEGAKHSPLPVGQMTLQAAAALLGVTRHSLHNLINRGLLKGELSADALPTFRGPRQKVSGYRRKAMLVPQTSVESLKAAMDACRDTPAEPRGGRPPQLLFRAAEALRDGTVAQATSSAAVSPITEAAPKIEPKSNGTSSPKHRGGRPKGSLGRKAARRRQELLRRWDAGEFDSVADAAKSFQIDPSTAWKILHKEGRLPERQS